MVARRDAVRCPLVGLLLLLLLLGLGGASGCEEDKVDVRSFLRGRTLNVFASHTRTRTP